MSTVTNLIGAMNRRGGGGAGGEATAVQNVGTGAGLVYRDLTGTTVNLRTIKAGTGVTVTNNADDITITNSAPESTAVSNVGGGAGLVYRDMSGSTVNLKTVKGGSYITVTNNADDITIANSAPESTAVSNVGAGAGLVYRDMSGSTINLKTVKGGSYITITNNADDITITGTTPGEANTAANVGAGAGLVFRDKVGVTLNLKTVKAGTGITVTNNVDDITITNSAPETAVAAGNFIARQITSDSAIELSAFHDFVMDKQLAAQPYFTGKAILSSLDWQYVQNVGLNCIAANNATDSFRVSVPADFDYWVRFTPGAAAQTGLVITGLAQTASFTWDSTPRLVCAFTGQANINIAYAGSTVWLRIVRDSQYVKFYYRAAGTDPWILVAAYLQNLGNTVTASLRSGIGARVDELCATEGIPEIRAENVGLGAGLLVRDIVSSIVNVKSVKGGSYITVTNNADDVTISGLAPGETNTAANVGTGSGTVYKDKTGVQLNFRSLNPLYGMYILDNGNNIDIKLSIAYSPLTDGATISLDAINGPRFKVTLGGNRTLANPTNPQGSGQMIIIRVKQDATGNRTLAFDTKYRFSTDLPSPVLSTAANKIDYLGFIYNQDDDKWDFISFVKGF